MSTTPGTIMCRLCGAPIAVEFTRLPFNVVALAPSVQPLRDHYAACPALERPPAEVEAPAATVPKAELVGRIERVLNDMTKDGGRHFVSTAGSRACTMCGMPGADCMALIGKPLTGGTGKNLGHVNGCCGACANGNTHTAPGEAAGTCAQWAADHGCKS